MSLAAKLIEKYYTELMSNGDIRDLCSSVSQDAQNETVDFAKSRMTVRQGASYLKDRGLARRQIISWLNYLYFSMVENTRLGENAHFWWEMHTRIQKLLVVSMILEGDNLRGFGTPEEPVVPEAGDIPQCLVEISLLLDELRKDVFPYLKERYVDKIHRCDTTYLQLYLEKQE